MKKKIEILCSTGTLVAKINGRDSGMITRYCPEIECDGFEFMMVPEFYEKAESIARSIKESGLNFKTYHIEKDIGWYLSRLDEGDCERAFDYLKKDLKMADMLGLDRCVLHLWGGEQSDSHVERNIEFLPKILELGKEYGKEILIENVPCTTHSPYENVKKIVEIFPEQGITFDSRFAAFHSQEKTFCNDTELWSKNIRHVHISDISKQCVEERTLRPILHPYEGCCDFDTVCERLKKSYTGTLTVESPIFLPNFGADTDKLSRTVKGLNERLNG